MTVRVIKSKNAGKMPAVRKTPCIHMGLNWWGEGHAISFAPSGLEADGDIFRGLTPPAMRSCRPFGARRWHRDGGEFHECRRGGGGV
ncbi:MAG: hypothetical protein JXD22_04590 [Sedimentisphaerales bacterium]|nr:hypothetical protein [Sedimentisphaerales bacterium]